MSKKKRVEKSKQVKKLRSLARRDQAAGFQEDCDLFHSWITQIKDGLCACSASACGPDCSRLMLVTDIHAEIASRHPWGRGHDLIEIALAVSAEHYGKNRDDDAVALICDLIDTSKSAQRVWLP